MPALSPTDARRTAVSAQLLAEPQPASILDVVRRIGFLQLDPTAAVAPSHLLVLWSRLGPYDTAELDRLLWQDKLLFEWRAFVYPVEELPLYLSLMRRFPAGDTAWPSRVRDWLAANARFRRYVLGELERRGPLLSRELEDRSQAPWRSTGWTGNRNVGQMLELLTARGDVAVAGRRGAQRLWDLAERWYPAVEPLPAATADALLEEKRLRTLGVVRRDGEWVAHAPVPAAFAGRTTLLSPFDRLIHDRVRTLALFDFDYRLEIYVPRAKRRHGYFVLPILHGDRLVGRIDPLFDRKEGVLRINAVHWEGDPVDIDEPVSGLADWLGAEAIVWP